MKMHSISTSGEISKFFPNLGSLLVLAQTDTIDIRVRVTLLKAQAASKVNFLTK